MEAAVELVSEKMNVKLKDKQLEAVLSFMSGNDVFVSLPTGYGKSLIYGILPLAFDIFRGRKNSDIYIILINLFILM